MPARANNSSEYMQLLIAINDSIGADNPTMSVRIHRLTELYENTQDSILRAVYIREINRYTRALNRTLANQTAASRRLNTNATLSLAIPITSPESQEPSITDILQSKDIIIPNEYLCPITLEIMKDPVVLEDGHIYEKTAIMTWFQKNNTNPLTKKIVNKNILIPCHIIRSIIQDFIKIHTDSLAATATNTSIVPPNTCKPQSKSIEIQTDDIVYVQSISAAKVKQKRKPSEYNIFVKERMSIYKQQYPSELSKDIMKRIGQEWKAKKI
jgi:hypothetical protein